MLDVSFHVISPQYVEVVPLGPEWSEMSADHRVFRDFRGILRIALIYFAVRRGLGKALEGPDTWLGGFFRL